MALELSEVVFGVKSMKHTVVKLPLYNPRSASKRCKDDVTQRECMIIEGIDDTREYLINYYNQHLPSFALIRVLLVRKKYAVTTVNK